MFEINALQSQVQEAQSHALENLHRDGMDSLAAGARWLLLLLAVLVLRAAPSWKVLLPVFGAGFLLDAFGVERLTESLRGKWIYPRTGYVAVKGDPVSPKKLVWYFRPVAVLAAIADSSWFFVLFFNVWWGAFLAVFGPALVNSLKYDKNRWPRHFLFIAAALLVLLAAHTPSNLFFGAAGVMVIYLADGVIGVVRFVAAHPKQPSPSV